MSSVDQAVQVYQLRIWIRQISPQIWRRLLVRSDSTIAQLHDTLQLRSAGWMSICTNSSFGGSRMGGRSGGMSFDDNPYQVQLRDFHFHWKETWVYEYDLTDWWQHEVRLEQVLPFDSTKQYPICLAGKRRGPIEHCGGPRAFMELQDEYPLWKVLPQFAQLLLDHRDGLDDYQVEEVACFERDHLSPETLGLRLEEAKQMLAGVQQVMTAHQIEGYVQQQRQCSHCQQPLTCKGHHSQTEATTL